MADLEEKEPPDRGGGGIDPNQSGIAYRSTTQHVEEAKSQEAKCEPAKPVANFQIGKMNLDKLDIPITSEKSQETDKNTSDSPATPLYADARTSTTENSPLTEEENKKRIENSQNSELNQVIKYNTKQILTDVVTDAASVHSLIPNVENDDIIFQVGNNPKLPSPSEVEQTVGKGVTVEELNVAKVGKSTEYSPDFAEDNNTTVIETAKQKQFAPNELAKIAGPIENEFKTPESGSEASSKSRPLRRSVRIVACSSSGNENCKKKMVTVSEKYSPDETNMKKRKKMSPEEGEEKKARREKRNKEREAEPCNCGGNKNSHELLLLMEENGTISNHRCIGTKEETEKQIGKGLYTK